MKTKILVIVEGETEQTKIFGSGESGLLSLLGSNYEFCIVKTPIYELYRKYKEGLYDDLVSYLRETGKLTLPEYVRSRDAFSAVYLVFDFDPQYHRYTDDAIREIVDIFDNETDMGKIYINYPMVEAAYHVISRDDRDFLTREINLDNVIDGRPLTSESYKKLVRASTIFDLHGSLSDKDLYYAIFLNYKKIMSYAGEVGSGKEYKKLLELQIEKKNNERKILVLASVLLIAVDYNKELVSEIIKREINLDL